jgi:hypothetical protein
MLPLLCVTLFLGVVAAVPARNSQSSKCWPRENFAMLKPGSGCPVSDWPQGSVTNFLYRNSTVPADDLLDANVDGAYLNTHYCGHSPGAKQAGCEEADKPAHFPEGSYCVYMYELPSGIKITENCPTGFKWAWIAIDDVDNFNRAAHEGHVPLGEFFSFSTVQYYCCREDGDPSKEIVLPTAGDFVLFPTLTTKTCQKVTGMNVKKDEIFYSTEDVDSASNGAPAAPDFPPPEYRVDAALNFWGRGLHIAICHYSPKTGAPKKIPVKAKTSAAVPKCWPETNYAFLAPKTGCPSGQGWATGAVQHWEQPGGKSKAPEYLNAKTEDQKFTLHYCSHNLAAEQKDTTCNKQDTAVWEAGSYCFFHYEMSDRDIFDKSCPDGFNYHWFVIDDVDKDNQNNFTGAVPSGEYYDYATVYYACCRDDGNVNEAIHLPTDKPFVLMPTATDRKCQAVAGMKARYDEVFYDSEDVDSDVVPLMKEPYTSIDYTIDHPKGKWGAGMRQKICYYTKA